MDGVTLPIWVTEEDNLLHLQDLPFCCYGDVWSCDMRDIDIERSLSQLKLQKATCCYYPICVYNIADETHIVCHEKVFGYIYRLRECF